MDFLWSDLLALTAFIGWPLQYSIYAALSLQTTHPPRCRPVPDFFRRLIKFLTLEAVQISLMKEQNSDSLSLSISLSLFVNVFAALRRPIPVLLRVL
jgi:hypothetical protein